MSGYDQPKDNPIGRAGFILSIVGLFVGITAFIGLPLSIVGFIRAKREGLPTNLSIAGIILSSITIVFVVLFVALVVVLVAAEIATTGSAY